ncbi:MAG: ATP-binding protein [Sphingobacteriia bacterium]|jgi:signal transduction histidine kinase
MKQLLVFFWMILSLSTNAQTRVIDSVRKSLFPDFNPATSALLLKKDKNDPIIDTALQKLAKTTNPKERANILGQIMDQRLLGANFDQKTSDSFLIMLKELVSLKKQLKQEDYKAYNSYYELASIQENIYNRKNLERFALLKQTIELFDQFNKPIPVLLSNIRSYFNSLNLQEERYVYYEQKLKIYIVKNNRTNMAACFHGLGGYYNTKAAYNRAISHYLKAADIYKDFNTIQFCNDLSVSAQQYARWGNFNRAKELNDSAISIGLNLMKIGILKISFLQGSEIATISNAWRESIAYCDSLIKYSNVVSDLDYYPVAFARKGVCLIELGDFSDGMKNIEIAEKLADSIKKPFFSAQGAVEVDYGKFLFYSKNNQSQKALAFLNTAYQKAIEAKVNDEQKKYLTAFKNYYASINDFANFKLYSNKLDALTKEMDATLAPFKIAYYEIEKKELQQLDSLNAMKQQKAIQDAVIQKNNLLLWLSLGGILIVAIALYYVNRQLQINKKNLEALKATQSQLVQSEKMASLGELTAGIAHEIQNPLNFVNNFSEVSNELIAELNEEKQKPNLERDTALEEDLLKDISTNLEKINLHGKRAADIVKSMLQHSRTSSGQKEPTDINALCDEYFKLSYHGLRAKDKSFNATLVTDLDPSNPVINIIPQDIGRVVLNLINNAFYVVDEKAKSLVQANQLGNFEPSVTISTKKMGNKLSIAVKDNGNGIPPKTLEKIFQPFFTTKPTGQGTGLGLSLSYDMVKAHGGELKVTTKEGEGTEFIIELPL